MKCDFFAIDQNFVQDDHSPWFAQLAKLPGDGWRQELTNQLALAAEGRPLKWLLIHPEWSILYAVQRILQVLGRDEILVLHLLGHGYPGMMLWGNYDESLLHDTTVPEKYKNMYLESNDAGLNIHNVHHFRLLRDHFAGLPGPIPWILIKSCSVAADQEGDRTWTEDPKELTAEQKRDVTFIDGHVSYHAGHFSPSNNGRGMQFLRALANATGVITEASIDYQSDGSAKGYGRWSSNTHILRVMPSGGYRDYIYPPPPPPPKPPNIKPWMLPDCPTWPDCKN